MTHKRKKGAPLFFLSAFHLLQRSCHLNVNELCAKQHPQHVFPSLDAYHLFSSQKQQVKDPKTIITHYKKQKKQTKSLTIHDLEMLNGRRC